MDDFNVSLTLFIFGVISSRIGLWVFDVAITQLMQMYIPANVRGVVGGVQKALNSFFGMFAFVLGLLFPTPSQFDIFVLCGYICVGTALILYAVGIWFRRSTLAEQFRVED